MCRGTVSILRCPKATGALTAREPARTAGPRPAVGIRCRRMGTTLRSQPSRRVRTICSRRYRTMIGFRTVATLLVYYTLLSASRRVAQLPKKYPAAALRPFGRGARTLHSVDNFKREIGC